MARPLLHSPCWWIDSEVHVVLIIVVAPGETVDKSGCGRPCAVRGCGRHVGSLVSGQGVPWRREVSKTSCGDRPLVTHSLPCGYPPLIHGACGNPMSVRIRAGERPVWVVSERWNGWSSSSTAGCQPFTFGCMVGGRSEGQRAPGARQTGRKSGCVNTPRRVWISLGKVSRLRGARCS